MWRKPEMPPDFARLYVGQGRAAVLARAVAGSAGLRLVGMGLGFLVGVQLARSLGVEGYGVYGLAMAIISVLTVPTEFGLPQLLTREVAAAHTRHDAGTIHAILRWSTKVSLIMAVLIGVALLIWLMAWGGGLQSSLALPVLAGALLVPVAAQVSLRCATLRGLQQIVKGELPDVLLRPLFFSILLLVVPWVLGPLTPTMAMALGVVSAFTALLFAQHLLAQMLPVQHDEGKRHLPTGAWWLSALPMAATNGLGVLRGQLLVLMLGLLLTAADVGQYRIATSILMLVLFPVSVLNTALAPSIASLHVAGDRVALRKVLLALSAGSAVGVLLLSIPFFVLGDWLVPLVFGAGFDAANSVLVILCGGLFLSNLFGGNVVLLNMTGHHRDVMLVSAASLVVLVVAGYGLVAQLGLQGAALAYVVSNISSDILMWVMARKRLGLAASVFLAAPLIGSKGAA